MPATDLAHPVENRPLSIQEYKRIQEFPDEWEIEGTLVERYKQLGNAVPISLGWAVGNLLMSLLQNEDVKQYHGFPYSRYKNTDEKSWGVLMEKRGEAKTKKGYSCLIMLLI